MVAEIHDYKSESSESAADKYIEELFDFVERLERYPESCAPCRNPKLNALGLRCCLFKKQHVVIYEVLEEKVEILAVIHAKRNPTDFEDIIE